MNLEVTLAGKTFKNPVTTASGTFGSGAEYEQFVDLSLIHIFVLRFLQKKSSLQHIRR